MLPAPRAVFPERARSLAIELLIFALGLAVLYGVVAIARSWLGPVQPAAHISRSPWALPGYTAASLLRIGVAYALSLVFAVGYGYLAASNRKAERFLIPLLDVMQSIPVLSFLPGLMLVMVALFPSRELGLELGSILLIFTGQVWNMAFSFYSSLKSIPNELEEATRVYGFNRWQCFFRLLLPFGTIGLVWNSMMSVAGGWFFLMACEMFVLGQRDFRLRGLGSYLQVASSAGDIPAMLWGLGAMIGVIVLLDLLVWRPVTAWADKFKFEQVESASPPTSAVFDSLRSSAIVGVLERRVFEPVSEKMALYFARRSRAGAAGDSSPRWRKWLLWILAGAVLAWIAYGSGGALLLLRRLTRRELEEVLSGAGITFLRVSAALAAGAAWAVPAGVAIGFHPRLARVAQPLAQIAASVPATALFPVLLLVLIQAGGGLGIASILLMLLGTQWYILFNVIAGAMAIPTDLKEAAALYRFTRLERWRWLILPGIFPYLVTGMVTAAGGAWNASIVAEYFHFKGRILSTTGLGATISRATDSGNFGLLIAATITMSAIVVTINRLVWRRLYRLAETRFKLES